MFPSILAPATFLVSLLILPTLSAVIPVEARSPSVELTNDLAVRNAKPYPIVERRWESNTSDDGNGDDSNSDGGSFHASHHGGNTEEIDTSFARTPPIKRHNGLNVDIAALIDLHHTAEAAVEAGVNLGHGGVDALVNVAADLNLHHGLVDILPGLPIKRRSKQRQGLDIAAEVELVIDDVLEGEVDLDIH